MYIFGTSTKLLEHQSEVLKKLVFHKSSRGRDKQKSIRRLIRSVLNVKLKYVISCKS
jgi:hypothetical protein